ncbi:MAG: COG1470 family protein, partial [Promethearchaeota archaeon]
KNHKMYISDVSTTSTIIQPHDCLVVYRNGCSFSLNNDDFEEIKLYDYEDNLIYGVDYADSSEGVAWAYVNDMWKATEPSPGAENSYQELPEYDFDLIEIENLGSNDKAEFGQMLQVRLNAYKGDYSKNSVKLWVENDDNRISKTTKFNLKSKFSNYTLTIPVQLYPNCNGKYKEGNYDVCVSWYSPTEVEDSLSFKVKDITDELCDKIYLEKSPRKGTLIHKLVEAPSTIEIGKEFFVKVELTNNDGIDHLVDLYSYVYRGSKCYSASREANKKSVLIKSDQTKEFELENIVEEAEPGDYKFKIKIKRDDQKTTKEITREIKIIGLGLDSVSEIIDAELEKPEDIIDLMLMENYTGNTVTRSEIVYESSNERIKRLTPYFIIAFMAIMNIYLILKKG